MNYLSAVNQVKAIIEAVAPSNRTRGMAWRFKHYPRATEAILPQDRGFWFDLKGGAVRGPLTCNGILQGYYANLDVIIRYNNDVERYVQDANIAEDWRLIADELCDPATWLPDSTGLVSIGMGEQKLLQYAVEEVTGARLMRFGIEIEYIYEAGGF